MADRHRLCAILSELHMIAWYCGVFDVPYTPGVFCFHTLLSLIFDNSKGLSIFRSGYNVQHIHGIFVSCKMFLRKYYLPQLF